MGLLWGGCSSRGLLFSTFLPPLKHSRNFTILPKKSKKFKIIPIKSKKTSNQFQKIQKNFQNNSQNSEKLLSKNWKTAKVMSSPLMSTPAVKNEWGLLFHFSSQASSSFWGRNTCRHLWKYHRIPRWWFEIFFIFILTWGNDPIWLIIFRWVGSTTN